MIVDAILQNFNIRVYGRRFPKISRPGFPWFPLAPLAPPTPKFRILTFWTAPRETLKTSLKRRVSTHFRCPWAGGHKSLFQDGEYATFLSQFVHHRFLRYKPFWTPRITSQMYAEYENHDTKAGLDPHEGFVNRFVTLLSAKPTRTPKNPV